MGEYNWGCQICETLRRPLVCPSCVQRTFIGESFVPNFQALQQRRAILEARVAGLLEKKAKYQAQQLQLVKARQLVQDAIKDSRALEDKAHLVRRELEDQRSANRQRRAQITQAEVLLEARQRDLLTRIMPDFISSQRMHHMLVRNGALELARKRLGSLQEILPLSIVRDNDDPGASFDDGMIRGRAPYVSIRGLRLPETLEPSMETASHVERVTTALGYMLRFLDLAAFYLESPVLHVLRFQASTSRLWLPHSFSDRKPAPLSKRLYLFHHVLPELPQAKAPTPLSSVLGETGNRAMYKLSKLKEQWDTFKQEQGYRQVPPLPGNTGQTEALAVALGALSRSVGVFLADQLGPHVAHLPPHWNPFACLAAVCAHIGGEAGHGSLQLQHGAEALTQSGLPHAHALCDMLLTDFLGVPGRLDEEEGAEGWDMVQRPRVYGQAAHDAGVPGDAPFLPPTPSQEGDVAHWERAMIHDTNSVYLVHTRTPLQAAFPMAMQSLAAIPPGALAAAQGSLAAAQSAASHVTHLLGPLRRTLGA